MKPNPQSTLRQLLRHRPRAVLILEKALGAGFWPFADQTLADFCAHSGILPGDLLDEVAALAPVPADTEWERHPLCLLLDHLTATHVEFRDQDLPRLRGLIRADGLPVWPDRYALDLVIQDFSAFSHAFLIHMSEEEGGEFPGILEADSRLRHLPAKPSAARAARSGAARALAIDFAAPSIPDDGFGRMLVDIEEKLRFLRVSPEAATRLDAIRSAFEEFHGKLARHARLETEVLTPRVELLKTEAGAA